MGIAAVFIRRPRLAFVVSAIMVIAGLLALGSLPIAQFPNIVPPEVTVTTSYPGASAQVVEESVAQVIEAQVNGVERMIYMKSTNANDGTLKLIVSFEVGTDLATWPTGYSVPDTVTAGPPVAVVDNLDGTDTVTLTVASVWSKFWSAWRLV